MHAKELRAPYLSERGVLCILQLFLCQDSVKVLDGFGWVSWTLRTTKKKRYPSVNYGNTGWCDWLSWCWKALGEHVHSAPPHPTHTHPPHTHTHRETKKGGNPKQPTCTSPVVLKNNGSCRSSLFALFEFLRSAGVPDDGRESALCCRSGAVR